MSLEQRIKVFYSPDGTRRFFIERRHDGLFTFSEDMLSFDDCANKQFWEPVHSSRPGIYDSAETAQQAARDGIPWFRSLDGPSDPESS
jgi:hypothetical protein